MVNQLNQQLQAGILPPQFLEEYEIVSPDDPAARAFSAYMQTIAKRVFGDKYDPQTHPINFVLSASEEPNILSVGYANPPIVGITRGMLRLLESEDELAAGALHEAVHLLADDKLGFHPVMKPEEMAADVMPVVLLQRGGVSAKCDGLAHRQNSGGE